MMQKKTCAHPLAAKWCLLMLSIPLIFSACGGSSSPSSQPNSPQQATPTKSGYSLISLLDQEVQFFLAPQRK